MGGEPRTPQYTSDRSTSRGSRKGLDKRYGLGVEGGSARRLTTSDARRGERQQQQSGKGKAAAAVVEALAATAPLQATGRAAPVRVEE
jgi:hypothetical protein